MWTTLSSRKLVDLNIEKRSENHILASRHTIVSMSYIIPNYYESRYIRGLFPSARECNGISQLLVPT